MNKDNIQNYINNFRRRLAPFLKPSVGVLCKIFPADDEGAILEFTIGLGIENDDNYEEVSPSLGKALAQVHQRAFGGNLEGFRFGGTNTIFEENRVIYMKDASSEEWSDEAAAKDVVALVNKSVGGKR